LGLPLQANAQSSSGKPQAQQTWAQWHGEPRPMIDLIGEGYEIKAALGNMDIKHIYVQKGPNAYLCVDFLYKPEYSTNALKCHPLQKPMRRVPD
jgi:hypothetical protein